MLDNADLSVTELRDDCPEKELPLALCLQLHCTSLLQTIFLGMASVNPSGTVGEDYQRERQCNTQ